MMAWGKLNQQSKDPLPSSILVNTYLLHPILWSRSVHDIWFHCFSSSPSFDFETIANYDLRIESTQTIRVTLSTRRDKKYLGRRNNYRRTGLKLTALSQIENQQLIRFRTDENTSWTVLTLIRRVKMLQIDVVIRWFLLN